MDDDVLRSRFDRLAAAAVVDPPPVARLVDRSHRRRRRRARRVGGASLAILLVVAGAVAVRAGGRDDRSVGVATHPSSTTAPATTTEPVPAGPLVWTFGAVPDDLSHSYCTDLSWSTGAGPDADQRILCDFADPWSSFGGGVRFVLDPVPASAERSAAFAAEAAEDLALPTSDGTLVPRFEDLGRHRVAAYGVTGSVESSTPGLDDRIVRTYALLVDGREVQVSVESATIAQVVTLLDGLNRAPTDDALIVPDGILPAGSQPMVQGLRPRWDSQTGIDPPPPVEVAGTTTGVDYLVPELRSPVTVERTTDVDLAAVWELLGPSLAAGDAVELEVGGHRAVSFSSMAAVPDELGLGVGPLVLVFDGPDRYLRVTAEPRRSDLPLAVARAFYP